MNADHNPLPSNIKVWHGDGPKVKQLQHFRSVHDSLDSLVLTISCDFVDKENLELLSDYQGLL